MRNISINRLNIKYTLLYVIYFTLSPCAIKAQYTTQDSLVDAKKNEKQASDTKQKIIGTWHYKNTFYHGTRHENHIDSNRVYIFTKKRAIVITNSNGKISKQKHKYIIYAYDGYSFVELGIDKDTKYELTLWITNISNDEFTFSPQYNDHLRVTFTKISNK